ncbi:agamous-like MADS-box protein AGL80 [Spinacia oleracea]|uniref:Agamous-like MADS-box protein AGL80 n=1 Tax=Spinacia oleracea TaxID=3562 RepID=A0A9R0JNT1_SPIOL|nr:agamous-like MADS-box protein AGL80 [Spinacia oleracea]
MSRKKVELVYKENDSARRTTFTKRAPSLIKKTREISVLCDVDALAIIYGQEGQTPVVWPPSKEDVRRIISKYLSKPEIDQAQRRLDQQAFLEQTIKKRTEQMKRIQRKNREIKIENLLNDIMHGRSTLEQVSPNDLGNLLLVLEDKSSSFAYQIRVLTEGNNNNPPPPSTNSNDVNNPI